MPKFKNRTRVRLIGADQCGTINGMRRAEWPSTKFFVHWDEDAAGNQVHTWHFDVDLEKAPRRKKATEP
jgi:hypothetical protein